MVRDGVEMMSDGTIIEMAIKHGDRRAVCAMTPVELRILMKRWGGDCTVEEAIRLERRRQTKALFRILQKKARRC